MKHFFLSSLLLLIAAACQKPEHSENRPAAATTLTETNPSADFNWSTSNAVSIQVSLTRQSGCSYSGPENPTVFLLDNNYKRIQAVVANANTAVFTNQIPTNIESVIVYLPETGAMKSVALKKGLNPVAIQIPCIEKPGIKKGNAVYKSGATSPNCATGCTRLFTSKPSNLTVSNGEVVCLSGNYNNVDVTFQNGGGTLRICGKISLGNVNLNDAATIIVSDLGDFSSNNLNLNNTTHKFYNYGKTSLNGSFSPNGIVENHGTMTINGELNINSQCIFTNTNTLQVNSHFNNNNKFTNSGKVDVTSDFTNNGSGVVINNCKISANKITLGGTVTNSGLIDCNNEVKIQGTALNLVNGGMITTKHLEWNSSVTCTGSTSMIKVSHKTSINGGVSVSGSLDVCDADGIETKNSSFGSNVKYCSNTTYIPVTDCNTTGYGVPAIADADGDGVADELDAFPNDGSKAFTDSYPYSGYAINGYEDLWPSTGDYDFNDLVIKYKVNYSKNAANKIVSANVEVVLSAAGGSLQNGLGLQFIEATASGVQKYKRLTQNVVSGASGLNGIQHEGDNVIKVMPNIRSAVGYNNTGRGPTKAPDTLRFNVAFNSAMIQPSNLIPDFFLYRSNERGLEIHLPNRPATALVNQALFKTFKDNTTPSLFNWYKTNNNLPWAIEIINGTNNFKHPLESVDITTAYPDFLNWVQSNGTSNTNWYSNPLVDKVFQQ